mgnify:CR=1 FL=1|tara:strand:- start:604 stop:876 length:273 start_codon:yes stop_codon:yes gene_type:complete
MIKERLLISIVFLIVSVFMLSMEKIKLSWEIRTLHNNYQNLQIENQNLKDLNIKLLTQSNIENSPGTIEKIAKESLGMIKKKPKRIDINE